MPTTTVSDDDLLLDQLDLWLKAGGEISVHSTAYGSQSIGVSLGTVRTNKPTFRQALTAAFVEHTRLRMLGDNVKSTIDPDARRTLADQMEFDGTPLDKLARRMTW